MMLSYQQFGFALSLLSVSGADVILPVNFSFNVSG